MSSYILGKLAGVLSGALVGILICVFAFKRLNSNGKLKTEYDERQKEIRNEGYKHGFWAITIYMVILMLLDIAEFNIPIVNTVIYFIGFFIGMVTMVIYCIWKGAYFGLNNKPKNWAIFIGIAGLINLLIGIMNYIQGDMINDGVLGTGFINLLCGVLIIVALVTLAIRKSLDNREEACDEES